MAGAEADPVEDLPLLTCESAWKSALDEPEIVNELLTQEVQEGFIAVIPGGLQQLKQQYAHFAVGKLGLVQAPGRSPRLVVDSSISNLTSNTLLPIICCCRRRLI